MNSVAFMLSLTKNVNYGLENQPLVVKWLSWKNKTRVFFCANYCWNNFVVHARKCAVVPYRYRYTNRSGSGKINLIRPHPQSKPQHCFRQLNTLQSYYSLYFQKAGNFANNRNLRQCLFHWACFPSKAHRTFDISKQNYSIYRVKKVKPVRWHRMPRDGPGGTG